MQTDQDTGVVDSALEFGGMVSTFTVLKVIHPDAGRIAADLRRVIERSPGFFDDAPVALDLSGIDASEATSGPDSLSLTRLLAILRAEGLAPVAVCEPQPERRAEARSLGLAVVRGGARRRSVARTQPAAARAAEPEGQAAPPPVASVTLRQPVRGGQVVYAEGADAVVLAPVNAGGEVIADGNIHIYAPLRGRALAGAHGDVNARVFCQKLEAELVSVAGVYLHAEQLPESHRGRPAQIYLEGETLVVGDL